MHASRFTKYHDRSIHYVVSGKGEAVVLLHGLPATGKLWKGMMDALPDFYVIAPDLPGAGSSEILDRDPTIEDYAEVIATILEQEGIATCTLIGHSIGGYIALAFAEKHPGRLKALGLFHSTARADDEEKIKSRRKAIEFMQANGSFALLKTSTPNLFAGGAHLMEIEELLEESRRFHPQALIYFYEAMILRPDRTAVLENFPGPVLFIMGEKDSVIPLQASLEQCHLPVISHVHILDTGHMGMIEDKGSQQLVRSFLENT